MRQIFLDTETTGLSADKGDRLVEIGCIEMVSRRLTGRNLHLYLNPERASHPEALQVHGLTEAFLADKPRFAEVAEELLAYLAGAELVIHNASFDLGFIDAELRRLRRGPLRTHVAGVVDTLLMAREMFPGKHASLDALCKRFEVDNKHRQLHGALLDAGLLAEVYVRMTRGQDALEIDDGGGSSHEQAIEAVDLASYALPVISANDAECMLHQAVLAELQEVSGGRTLWCRVPPADEQAPVPVMA